VNASPFETAARWHAEHCPGDSLVDVLEAHLRVGHVVAGPRLFLMGRQVSSRWGEDELADPWRVDLAGDCWHVWLFAGDLGAVPSAVPYPLPWVTFHRSATTRLVRLPLGWLLARLGSRVGQ
jgi:hypothetical protein